MVDPFCGGRAKPRWSSEAEITITPEWIRDHHFPGTYPGLSFPEITAVTTITTHHNLDQPKPAGTWG
ncbi:MAG: hypothetical protein V1775_18135 [Bacteroidota bacterium]